MKLLDKAKGVMGAIPTQELVSLLKQMDNSALREAYRVQQARTEQQDNAFRFGNRVPDSFTAEVAMQNPRLKPEFRQRLSATQAPELAAEQAPRGIGGALKLSDKMWRSDRDGGQKLPGLTLEDVLMAKGNQAVIEEKDGEKRFYISKTIGSRK